MESNILDNHQNINKDSNIMTPGVHDISIDQYHSGPGISRSGIQIFRRSPLHYWHNYLRPNIEKEPEPEIITKRNALSFGNAFHTYVLEKDQFGKRYMVAEKHNRTTTVGKKAHAEMLQLKGNKQLLCSETFEEIKLMNAQIDSSPTGSGLIAGALYEKSLFWTDKDTGLLCKVRPDIWHKNMVVDLKTCCDASPREFKRSVFSYGYYMQAAMIHEALYALYDINMMDFIFLAIEKDPPYAVAIYQLDELTIQRGVEDFKETLWDMKECFETNFFPSYPDSIVDLPSYF
jgi:hypothetical protein